MTIVDRLDSMRMHTENEINFAEVEIKGYTEKIYYYQELKQQILRKRTELYNELKDIEDSIYAIKEMNK